MLELPLGIRCLTADESDDDAAFLSLMECARVAVVADETDLERGREEDGDEAE